ncbi:ACT domain-containing protein [Candidatus Micrarchaeota archaeon]|nr:ACT domain-containing protein [Candidatus Micrarchaeota archaeon]
MRELIIVAKDQVGLLAKISKILGDKSINIDSVSVEPVGRDAMIHLVVSQEKEAMKLLEDAGYKVSASDVIVLKIEDQPGELAKVALTLAESGINIRSVLFLRKEENKGLFAVKVTKPEKAVEILKDYL